MNAEEKLLRIKALMAEKKTQEDIFQIKVKNINDEIYAKQINPLLINFLNFSAVSMEKLYKTIDRAGAKFNKPVTSFTREQYDKGVKSLEQGPYLKFKDFFEIFDASIKDTVKLEEVYNLIEQIEDIVKDVEFIEKHKHMGLSLEKYTFSKYLKAISDQHIISILEKPFKHIEYIKIHGIWEVMNSIGNLNEDSYLLGHCSKAHSSCWPIISEGLKICGFGGRCGRGIYFSNDMEKCLQYSSWTDLNLKKGMFGIMFFTQVFFGKIRTITRDNGSLTKSSEYDTILASGMVSPKKTALIPFSDGTNSKVFIDVPVHTQINSSFLNNEYVIYDEKRCRLRYIVLFSKENGF